LAAAVFLATVFLATAAFLVAAFFTVATFLPAALWRPWWSSWQRGLLGHSLACSGLLLGHFLLQGSGFGLGVLLGRFQLLLGVGNGLADRLGSLFGLLGNGLLDLGHGLLGLGNAGTGSLGGALDGLLDRLHGVFGGVGDGLANVGGGFFDVLDGVGHDRHTITVAHVALLGP
jgi:hypothetical protein